MRCTVLVLLFLVFDTGTGRSSKQIQNSHKGTIKYYTKQTNITIPIMIHLDKPLTRIISKEKKHKIIGKFKLLAKDILKDVEELFTHQSLHQKIKLQLLDVKIIKNSMRKLVMSEDVSKYLRSYCDWQGEKKMAKKKWYYSVMFTGLDVYYLDKVGAKVRSSTGRGYMRGMCSNRKSCTLLEWHPQNIAFVLAHEIAHSLNVPHDGPPYNECSGRGYIMDSKYNPKNLSKIWSPCSKRSLSQYLESKQAWCLRQDSPISLYNSIYS